MEDSKVYIVVVGTIIFFVLLYLFILKPNNIRRVCRDEALIRSIQNYPESKYSNVNERARLQEKAENSYYNNCIGVRGLQV